MRELEREAGVASLIWILIYSEQSKPTGEFTLMWEWTLSVYILALGEYFNRFNSRCSRWTLNVFLMYLWCGLNHINRVMGGIEIQIGLLIIILVDKYKKNM